MGENGERLLTSPCIRRAAEQRGWSHQEASSPLRLIAAIGEDEDIRGWASEVRQKVRNKWAHEEDVNSAVFGMTVCMEHIMTLVGAMPAPGYAWASACRISSLASS